MGVKELPVRREVFEGIDPSPKLGKILEVILDGKEPEDLNTRLLSDPLEFFKRTFITDNMLELLENVLEAFEGRKKRTFALYSFYGGGKTHTILAVIHAFRNPEVLTQPEILSGLEPEERGKLESIADRIKGLNVKVVPFAGEFSKYSGSPLSPTSAGGCTYRTVWGYLAHALGKYDEFSEFDVKLSAPQQDVIERMLSGSRVLFVFDEIMDYLVNLVGGEYSGYARAVVNFFEYFIQALKSSESVAILTLPVDFSGKMDWQNTERDWRYKDVEEIASSLWNTLKENAVLVEPLSSGGSDIVNVLRKRLFEEIPGFVKDKTIQRYREKVENYINYFGSKDYVEDIKKTYPFSPEYIRLLENLILRTGLQKTRDALTISMQALRDIHSGNADPDLIMPWHIDLTEVERAFLRGLSDYRQIYIRQVEDFSDSGYGELSKYILRVIFLATYHYDSPVPLDHFPDRTDIVRMVYEPHTFSVNNLEVTDIENALSSILSSPKITHLNEKDGKYWFWKLPNIKEYIQRRTERIFRDRDPRIYRKIREYVETGLKGGLERFASGTATTKKGKKGSAADRPEHYFEEFYIIDDYDLYPDDTPKLKLVVLLRPEFVKEIENMFNYAKENTPRSYRNTLVFLSPVSSVNYSQKDPDYKEYEDLMRKAAGLIASDEVLEEISVHYKDYGQEAVDVQRSIVEREKKNYLQGLSASIPRVFSYVFFNPTNASGIESEKIVNPGYDLPFNVHSTLVLNQKIVEDMDFDYFVTLIRTEVGVDLETVDRIISVDMIVKWFFQNPRFPMTREKVIKAAIAKGIRLFRIGLIRGSGDSAEVFFKPVHDTIPPAKDVEGKVPSEIRNNDGVLSKFRAVDEQFRILKSRQVERVYPTHVERVYYAVYPELGGDFYTLDQLEMQPDWREIFLSGVIVRKVEKIDYDLIVTVYPSNTVTVEEGQAANFTIVARPVNLSIDGVRIGIKKAGRLIADDEMKLVKDEKGDTYRFEFSVVPESKREEFHAELVTLGGQKIEKQVKLVVVVKEKEEVFTTDEIGDEHLGLKLLRITEIEDFDVLEEIKNSILPLPRSKVDGVVTGRVKVNYGDGEMELDVRKMGLEVGIEAPIEVAGYGTEREITGKFAIEFRDTVLDELLIRKLEKLNRKVRFTLKRERV